MKPITSLLRSLARKRSIQQTSLAFFSGATGGFPAEFLLRLRFVCIRRGERVKVIRPALTSCGEHFVKNFDDWNFSGRFLKLFLMRGFECRVKESEFFRRGKSGSAH